MTAIAGIWSTDGSRADTHCQRVIGAQALYGRRNETVWNNGQVAFGRRLYDLLPEDRFDHGIISSDDGRFTLAADVRLDNRDELIGALGIADDMANACSDSHVLLQAWQRWEETALDRMVGDFAFAVWDQHARCLTLARDFLGQRPLFYHRGQGFFAFASMPKGLHALPEVPQSPDIERMEEFLALLPEAGTRSFFDGLDRVEPGTFVAVASDGSRAKRYWHPAPGHADHIDFADGMRRRLDEAVQARLRHLNGSIAAHLSAGYDSSAVAGTAATILRRKGERLVAFTGAPRSGYEGPMPAGKIVDETELAHSTATLHGNIEHTIVRSDGRSPLADLDRYHFLAESPILNICNFSWFNAINDAAKTRGVQVLLTGAMGNMTISYDGMQALPDLLRRGRLPTWFRIARGLRRSAGISWRGVVGRSVGPWIPEPLWIVLQRLRGKRTNSIAEYSAIRPARLRDSKLKLRAAERKLGFAYKPRADSFDTRLWALSRVDQGAFNKAVLGGWGIDLRDPTADRRLVEYCLSIPAEAFVTGGVPRALARTAFADRIAPDVLAARSRGLQGADWHERLTAARDEVLIELSRLDDHALAAKLIDIERLKKLVADWPSDGWDEESVIHQYRYALLRGISAGHFLRRASGANT